VKNLNSLLKILLEHQIDFILIGGYASVLHGSTYVTRDLDICGVISSDQIEKLRVALKDVHPRHRMNPNSKPSFLEEPKNLQGINHIYLETDLGVLDILSTVTGVGNFEILKTNSIEIPLFGSKCRVIGIEDLIKAKTAIGRDKDKLVVQELQKILELNKK